MVTPVKPVKPATAGPETTKRTSSSAPGPARRLGADRGTTPRHPAATPREPARPHLTDTKPPYRAIPSGYRSDPAGRQSAVITWRRASTGCQPGPLVTGHGVKRPPPAAVGRFPFPSCSLVPFPSCSHPVPFSFPFSSRSRPIPSLFPFRSYFRYVPVSLPSTSRSPSLSRFRPCPVPAAVPSRSFRSVLFLSRSRSNSLVSFRSRLPPHPVPFRST